RIPPLPSRYLDHGVRFLDRIGVRRLALDLHRLELLGGIPVDDVVELLRQAAVAWPGRCAVQFSVQCESMALPMRRCIGHGHLLLRSRSSLSPMKTTKLALLVFLSITSAALAQTGADAVAQAGGAPGGNEQTPLTGAGEA